MPGKAKRPSKEETMVRLSVLAFGLLALAGCGSSYHATLTNQTPVPDDSSFSLQGGQLHSGIAVAFSPSISESDVWGTSQDTDPITVTSSDSNVVGVGSVPSTGSNCSSGGSEDADSSVQCGQWLVWAIAPGTATVTIAVGGNTAASIPITVTDPPTQ
jgi:hypothetical protein